ncbi:hypothetical protein [Enterobacter sp. 148H3]|uniref:hypothetical protein n=1 Tax=Enterobacter sp. 148H3 TaxID=3077756 RepID=UPI0011BFA835|nr:hypothetical protein [Enterobacter sp. 148H3]
MSGFNIKKVLIYSPCWPIANALERMSLNDSINADLLCVVRELESVFNEILSFLPGLLIMDISLRDNCGLINSIRLQLPELPIIIVGYRYLFSDRVVAEYYGGILLKEYDALLAGYPVYKIQHHLTEVCFSGNYNGRGSCKLSNNPTTLIQELEGQLRKRLFDLTRSPRLCEVSMDWLIKGRSSVQMYKGLISNQKLIYHYRSKTMRYLKIRHYSRDFIRCLTVRIGTLDYFQKGGGIQNLSSSSSNK